MAELLQFGGSLFAILVLAWIALKLGLGGDRRIRDEAELRELTEEALFGFEPVEIGIDRAGMGALARDAEGRVMLLKRHGAHFASRMLDSRVAVRLDQSLLEVRPGEKRFGAVTLDLGDDAPAWAARLQQL